jgi:3-oxoacid CoA-transferase subunit A
MNKVVADAAEAVKDINDGAVIMLGGFGLCGIPENSIAALIKQGTKNLTCISNNAGVDDFGIGLMLQTRQVKKMISSYVGENAEFERQLLSGELEVDLIPQGTLATRCMAAKYGMPAVWVRAGFGTEIQNGKEARTFEFQGEKNNYLLEEAFSADYSIVILWPAQLRLPLPKLKNWLSLVNWIRIRFIFPEFSFSVFSRAKVTRSESNSAQHVNAHSSNRN